MSEPQSVELSRAAKSRAVRAIEAVHVAYDEKDGLRDTLAKVEGQKTRVSGHIHGLAVFASQTEKDLPRAIALYLAMCAYAEEQYKTKHSVTDLEEAIPVWKVYKSNILAAMRLGINPAEYESEYALRKEKDKRNKPTLLLPPAGAVRAGPQRAGPRTEEQIEELLTVTAVHDRLLPLVVRLIFESEYLKKSKVDEAEAILREAVDKLGEFVDQRRAA